jgi:hypothetical protein
LLDGGTRLQDIAFVATAETRHGIRVKF